MTRYIRLIFLCLLIVVVTQSYSQDRERVQQLTSVLDSLETSIEGLSKKVDFNVNNILLPNFLRAIGSTHKVNISVAPELENINLTHNFSNASVKNVLLYLCKEYSLTINPIGNILTIKKHSYPKVYTPKNIPITYKGELDLLSVDLQRDTLNVAFKKITDVTGKNLVYSVGLGSKIISSYIKEKSFESALDKIAFSNDLTVTKTNDGYYLFEELHIPYQETINNNQNFDSNGQVSQAPQRPNRYRNSNFYFVVKDSVNKIVDVDFQNTAINSVIKDIGHELNINLFTNTPLENIGTASVKAQNMSYDKLLSKILEDTPFTYKKKDNIYYFGKTEQATLRSATVIPLIHRSIEMMSEPMQNQSRGFNTNTGNNYNNNSYDNDNNYSNNSSNFNNNSVDRQRQNISTNQNRSFGNYQSKSEALINILPREIVRDLEIKADTEHNALIVSGDAQKIEKFRAFIKTIDKPVPVVLIEVMILEVSKTASVDMGVEFGLKDKPTKTKGTIFPTPEIVTGATTINKIIGGFKGFGSLNVGRVVPNFYAQIKAMETNGNVKIKSTPKLSTLNGHRAFFSSGERSYYAVTRRDIIGSQNPQTREIKNYVPIDADLSLAIKPMVSKDNQITLSINVVQSNFNGKRIAPDAPPGMNSREFSSTIRVKDQDVVILGGLEDNVKNDSGSGVPILARIPVIKWLFSKRVRRASKSKLSVLIKPTIIR